MWIYTVCGGIWIGIIAGWLVPMIRKHMLFKLYEVCGLGIYFSLLVLSWDWKATGILPLAYTGYALFVPAAAYVISSFISLRHKGKSESRWDHTTTIIKRGVL